MNHFKSILLIFLAFTISSCGTLKKRESMIYADSKPRGLKVKNEKGEVLGTTPFFFKVKTRRKRYFTFFEKDYKQKVKYKCQIDWGMSIAPDLVFIFNPFISGAFLVTDFLSGGAYKCRKPVLLKVTKSKPITKTRTKKIIVLPISTHDKGLSDKIIKMWKSKIHSKIANDKSEIIWNEETESAFFVRGMDHYADTHPKNIKRRFLNEVGAKFDATHFLHFKIEKKKKRIVVTPTLYDAFNLESSRENYLKKFSLKDKAYDSFGFWQKVVRMIDILPNSIRFGFSNVDNEELYTDNTLTEFKEYDVERHPEALNQLLTFVGLDSVHHPRFYDAWDYGGFLSPSLGASSFKSNQQNIDQGYEVLFESYYIAYDATFGIFTPFGQFGGGLGLGFMLFNFEDNRNESYMSTTRITHLIFNYTYFLSDRTFFKLAFDHYKPKAGKVHSELYDLKGWTEYSIGFGYYFPEIKAITRKILPF